MEPISPKVRATTIAVTLLLALSAPIILLQLAAPERPDPSFVGRIFSLTPSAGQSKAEGTSMSPATAVPSATRTLPATATPRISAGLFEGAYVDGVAELAGGRSMIRIVLRRPIQGNFRMEAGTGTLRPYVCFTPEAYDDRLYCYGPEIPPGFTILVRVYEDINGGGTLVFEATYFVQILPPSSTPKPGPDEPAPTATPTSAPTPTTTVTPSNTPSATAAATLTPAPPTDSPVPAPTDTAEPPTENPTPTATLPPPSDTPGSDLEDWTPVARRASRTARSFNCGSLARNPQLGLMLGNLHV